MPRQRRTPPPNGKNSYGSGACRRSARARSARARARRRAGGGRGRCTAPTTDAGGQVAAADPDRPLQRARRRRGTTGSRRSVSFTTRVEVLELRDVLGRERSVADDRRELGAERAPGRRVVEQRWNAQASAVAVVSWPARSSVIISSRSSSSAIGAPASSRAASSSREDVVAGRRSAPPAARRSRRRGARRPRGAARTKRPHGEQRTEVASGAAASRQSGFVRRRRARRRARSRRRVERGAVVDAEDGPEDHVERDRLHRSAGAGTAARPASASTARSVTSRITSP